MAGGLIRAGGALIELVLDKTSAMQGLTQFQARFRATANALNQMGFGANFGGGLSRVGQGLTSAVRNFFSGNTFANYFLRAGESLTNTVKNFFSGAFFERLSNGFRKAGQSLTFNGLLFSTILGGLSGLLTKPIAEFAKAEQQIGRFQSVFGNLSGEAAKFAEVLAKDVNQSVFELKDELATFQSILQGAGFDPRQAFEMSKMFTEATQDLMAFDDTITTAAEATDKLIGGLQGMVKPVERFGADIRKASLEEELLALGINETTNSLTQQERVLTRTQKIFEALSRTGAIGQARREVNTLAAVFRGAGAAAKEAAIAIGDALAPAANVILRAFTATARATVAWAKSNRGVILGAGAAIVALTGMGSAFIAMGLAAFSASAALKVAGAAMVAFATPVVAVVTAMKLAAAGLGAAVITFQLAGDAVRLMVRQFILAGGAVRAVTALSLGLAGMAKALAMVVAGTLVSGLARIGKYLFDLGSVGVAATKVLAISFASLAREMYTFAQSTLRALGAAFAFFTAQTLLAARAAATLYANMLKVAAVSAAGAFKATGALIKNMAISFAALTAVIAKGLVAAVLAGASGLLTLATSGVSAVASLAVTFTSVLVPVAAVALAIGGLVTLFAALKPQVQAFAQSLFASGGAIDGIFTSMKEAGRTAFSALSDGFNLLKSDAKEAFSGIADALKAGDIVLAAKILWATIAMEFATGWATVVPIFQQFGLELFTTANNLWAKVESVFQNGYQQIALIGTALSNFFVNTMSAVSGPISGAIQWLTSLFGSASSGMEGLWNSQENWILQITDILRDAFTVAINWILKLWDDVSGAIEKAWIATKGFTGAITEAEALRAAGKVDKQNAIREEGRQQFQNEIIEARRKEREKASREMAAERKRINDEIEAKRLEREKNFREMFGSMDENANARLEEATRKWDELLALADKERTEEDNKPPGESVLDGWRERIEKLMGEVGFGGANAVTSGRRSEAAFADMARFGIGSTSVEEKQLRELVRLRRLAEKNRPVAGAKAGP